MKLAEYLDREGIKRGDFAERIGVSAGRVTQLCDGGWPSSDVAEKIVVETGGAVTADDFLPARDVVEGARA